MRERHERAGLYHLAIYPAHLAQLVARFGVSRAELLEGTGIAEVELSDPDARIPDLAMSKLVHRAIRLTGEPGLAFYYGLQVKASAHGSVGLAAMTSATLGDALSVAERFFALRAPHLDVRHFREGDEAVVEFTEKVPLGDLLVFTIESLFTGLSQIANTLVGHPVTVRFDVTFPEPAHFQGFAHLLPGPMRFRRPANRMIYPLSALDEPLQMADAFAAQKAIAECERELATLGETSSLLASVRRQMMSRPIGFPTLTELADRRHVSPRTLKRQLAAHGTSFQHLLDELRRDRALALLEDEGIAIDRIAELLGYADPSNFNRAFRRWMGTSPSEWRAKRG